MLGLPTNDQSSSLKVLNFLLMLRCGGAGRKGPQIAAAASLWVFLSRVQAILSGFQFANHDF
jgi:hypothetical protein